MDTHEQQAVLKTLLVSDLVGSTRLVQELGDRAAAELGHRHDRLARDLLVAHGGREIDKTDGFLLLFERPLDAVRYALEYHAALRRLSDEESRPIEARMGIHLGEVLLRENLPDDVALGAKPLEVEGLAKPTTGRLMSLAQGGQTLLTRAAFDVARRGAIDVFGVGELAWLAHGDYLFKGVMDPIEVFEVGRAGYAPLQVPEDSDKARRADEQATITGWRPAPGLAIPHRRHWVVEKKLGEGGFGEAWLAHHEKSGDLRVFKFCYDSLSLRTLQREITLFRLLKGKLGDRDDIIRIIDWSFDEPPYSVESEYSEGGDVIDWAEKQGGLAEVPLAVRLEIVAQVATALAAAHSVGVLHKDVKPSNVLIAAGGDGEPRARLCDFGVGAVAEAKLADAGITALGLTAHNEVSPTPDSFAGTRLYGTRLYTAPEVLEGKPATLQADIYALGLMLYQVVVGDFSRALAHGWRRDVTDELLAEDIACAVDGSPERRLGNALRLAGRLRSLDSRRRRHEAERREKEEEARLRAALERTHKRRRVLAVAVVVLALFGGAMTMMVFRVRSEAARTQREMERTEKVAVFLAELFEVTDPFGTTDPGAARGASMTVGELIERGRDRLRTDFEDDPRTRGRLMGTLGTIYRSFGDFEEAEPLLEEALNLRHQALGEEHPDIATNLNSLAMLFYAKGDYGAAEPLGRESLEMRRRLLGNDHIDVATASSDLALVLRARGDYKAAEPLFRESLETLRRRLGDEHPFVGIGLQRLARLLHAKGDYEAAEPLFRESLGMARRLLGGDHLHLAISLHRLAKLLQTMEEHAEAEPLFRESIEMKRRLLGDEHPQVATGFTNLAWLLVARGQAAEAEPLIAEALAIYRQALPPHHWRIAAAESVSGSVLAALGHYEAAEPLLVASYPAVRKKKGERSPEARDALERLAAFYEAWGKPEKAAEYRELWGLAGGSS